MPDVAAIDMYDSIESLLAHSGSGSRSIYIATIVLVIVAVAGMYTSVDLTVRASGILAPSVERQTVRSQSDGEVAQLHTSEGSRVHSGDTLLALNADVSERALSAAATALETQRRRQMDLRLLVGTNFEDVPSSRVIASLSLAENRMIATATFVEWKQNSMHVTRAERTHDRQLQLMQRGFATTVDVETAEFELSRAREDRALAMERRRSEWTQALASTGQQIADLDRDVAARRSEQARRFVIAPVSGTIAELMPLSIGSAVRTGDALATISPDGEIVGDVLVPPKDVSYLKAGMHARLFIDGYDVQEWGGADATVTSVAQDYTLSDGRPAFRVRVKPLRAELRRADGTRALLGKGLHCEVRFLIGKKRLIALLRQRTNELLDPVASTAR